MHLPVCKVYAQYLLVLILVLMVYFRLWCFRAPNLKYFCNPSGNSENRPARAGVELLLNVERKKSWFFLKNARSFSLQNVLCVAVFNNKVQIYNKLILPAPLIERSLCLLEYLGTWVLFMFYLSLCFLLGFSKKKIDDFTRRWKAF